MNAFDIVSGENCIYDRNNRTARSATPLEIDTMDRSTKYMSMKIKEMYIVGSKPQIHSSECEVINRFHDDNILQRINIVTIEFRTQLRTSKNPQCLPYFIFLLSLSISNLENKGRPLVLS